MPSLTRRSTMCSAAASEDAPRARAFWRPIEVFAPRGRSSTHSHLRRWPAEMWRPRNALSTSAARTGQAVPDRIPAPAPAPMNNLTWRDRSPHGRTVCLLRNRWRRHGRSSRGGRALGVHTHMTNSLNTPAEALEYSYPLRVNALQLSARFRGERETRAATAWSRTRTARRCPGNPAHDRRRLPPWGLRAEKRERAARPYSSTTTQKPGFRGNAASAR